MTLAGFRSISKILVLMVLGLTLTLSLPVSASPKLTLNTALHTQQLFTVKLNPPQPWSSPFLYLWNFTLDFSRRRDPGSTIVKLAILNPTNLVAVLSDTNLTALPATRPPICQGSCPPLVTGMIELSSDVSAATPLPTGSLATLSFRPVASGLYHIAFFTDSTIIYISEIHGYETWTTTTVG